MLAQGIHSSVHRALASQSTTPHWSISLTHDIPDMPKASRVLGTSLAVAAAAAGLETAYLQRRYPVHEATSADLPAGIRRALPDDTNPEWKYCETTVPAQTAVQRTRPMESFVRHFYDIWTLRVEEAIARGIAYQEKFFPPPYKAEHIRKAHCGGLFPELSRDDTSCMIFFGPGGSIPAMADLQAFEAVPDGQGNLRLRFYTGNVDVPGAATDTGVMGWLHMMYVRFLLDAAKKKMSREREGELPLER